MRKDDLNGHILGTESRAQVEHITLGLSFDDAYALCNILSDEILDKSGSDVCEKDQIEKLRLIGQDLALFCDHSNRIKKFTK